MTWSENLFSNLLTVGILFGIGLVAYLKYTKQTFGDLVRRIKEFSQEAPAEVYNELQMQGGFENIR